MSIQELFEKFNSFKVLIIGDVMIDAYIWGDVHRISPEAPVPVFDMVKRESRLGGAANVALNIKSLGAEPIICSVIGKDDKAQTFKRLLNEMNLSEDGIINSATRKTTNKTRIISGNHHMLRLDEEMTSDINHSEEELLINRVKDICSNEKIDVIIFEDYNKGVLTEKTISEIVDFANEMSIPTTVDPKKKNFFSYKNVTLFKPNLKELKEGLKVDFDNHDDVALRKNIKLLNETLNNEISLITLSERGVFISNHTTDKIIPAHIRNIADVSGAGDTVISVASLCLAAGIDNETMAAIANLSGGLVCEKVGVVPIEKDVLLQEAIKELN